MSSYLFKIFIPTNSGMNSDWKLENLESKENGLKYQDFLIGLWM